MSCVVDFSIEKRRHRAEDQYPHDDLDLAYAFAKRCHDECRDLIKAIVLFGSTARKKQGANDVDVLVILDDVSLTLTPTLIQTYRIIIGKLVANISRRLHVTTLKFSAFWEYVRVGDPIAINILRDGFPLLDTGFFDPLQLLLHEGRIRPSPESVLVYQSRASQTLEMARGRALEASVDLYWAVMDAAHAALMSIGEVPPSPEHVAELLEDRLVRTKLVPSWAPERMRKFYTLSKEIMKRRRAAVSGAEMDRLIKEAEEFVEVMKKVVEKQ